MKTWRERLADRDPDLRALAMNYVTCACGEVAERYGLAANQLGMQVIAVPMSVSTEFGGGEVSLGGLFPYALTEPPNWRLAEWALDAIEDRALQLKREAGA